MLEVTLRHGFAGFSLDLSFTAPRRVTALFGPSGAGKSTVVNAVAGLMRPQAGRVLVGGETLFDSARGLFLPPHRRRVGYVFQDHRLFPHLDVRANLCYGARFAPRSAAGPGFDAVVEMLGIGALLKRRPALLSGGEKARVAIGRALLSKPRLLLLDEPLAALDGARREEILPFLEGLRDAGLPVLYVSHALAEVARLASTVVLIEAGRLRASGPVAEILSDPALAPALGAPRRARFSAPGWPRGPKTGWCFWKRPPGRFGSARRRAGRARGCGCASMPRISFWHANALRGFPRSTSGLPWWGASSPRPGGVPLSSCIWARHGFWRGSPAALWRRWGWRRAWPAMRSSNRSP